MKILAIDQARHGGWSFFNYETKKLISNGAFDFNDKKDDYPRTIIKIEMFVLDLINNLKPDAIFIEDIQLQKNADSFKKLAWLQGSLIILFQKQNILYDVIKPTVWQGFCNAKGRSSKEKKQNVVSAANLKNKRTKQLSIDFVKNQFDIKTDDDNMSDAICIGWYVVNNINIEGDIT